MQHSLDLRKIESCLCGKTYDQPGALKLHQRVCIRSKKRLSWALGKAKELWSGRHSKRRRLEDLTDYGNISGPSSESEFTAETGTILNTIVEDVRNEDMDSASPSTENSTIIKPLLSHTATGSGLSIGTESAAAEDLHLSIAHCRIRQERRLPTRYRDILPEPLPVVLPGPQAQSQQQETLSYPACISLPLQQESTSNLALPAPLQARSSPPGPFQSARRRVIQSFRSPRNIFGLYRVFHSQNTPSHDPEEHLTAQDLFIQETEDTSLPLCPTSNAQHHMFGPYPNRSSFLLGDWYWNQGVQKSQLSFRKLLEVIRDPQFWPGDIHHTKWNKIDAQLGVNQVDASDSGDGEEHADWLDENAGWKKTPIKITVPFHSKSPKPGPREFYVGDLHHRSLVSVIREKLANEADSRHFHYDPFELHWQPTDSAPDVRVYGELYTSPVFLEAHRKLQEISLEPDCELPRIILALMFWSDVTHLTSFGTANVWPCYQFFGNESKYRRCRPSCKLCNHVAFFQGVCVQRVRLAADHICLTKAQLPDAFQDLLSQDLCGNKPSQALLTHCRRELLHAQLDILLDEEFIKAYRHGIVMKRHDGIVCRFFPRIFTYSADYKEKVMLATIRDLGRSPCPRCLVHLSDVQKMGKKKDMKDREKNARVDDDSRRRKVQLAWDIIYKKNYAVDSEAVKEHLQEQSLVPTLNAFSKLKTLGVDIFHLLVVDLMHEFELGVWRALFIHLLRILDANDKNSVKELNRRFRLVPTFGRDTIRRFSTNVGELKKLAARDFEDILQCAIPVFDGLLPEPHGDAILQLLFVCAHWHGLAKLRMHTDLTLDLLDQVTRCLGTEFRKFTSKTCPAFNTKELSREVEARKRRQLKKTKPKVVSSSQDAGPSRGDNPADNGPRTKKFNLQTYKYHALGDYTRTIRQMGTTDSYSTESGELEHRTTKSWYKRTDRKNYVKQMTHIERRQARLRKIRRRLGKCADEVVEKTPHVHHHIGICQNQYIHIGTFLREHSGDPAVKNFLPALKEHLLARINDPGEGDVLFRHDRIYQHNIMRINYTTYDVRRSQDVINPSTSHCNIMVLNNEEGLPQSNVHPYRYAKVLGIYHSNILHVGPDGLTECQPRRMEFLWVRWYCQVEALSSGWEVNRLDRVRFLPVDHHDAFGFIDPLQVLRSCHMIPGFARGVVHADRRGLSRCVRDAFDWRHYYVNRFVDRDMILRYYPGLGVGHAHVRLDSESHNWSIDELAPVSPWVDDAVERESDAGDVAFSCGDIIGSLAESEDPHLSEDLSDEGAPGYGDEGSEIDPTDDEEFLGMEEMYYA